MSVMNGNSAASPLSFDGQLDASSALYAVEVNDSSDVSACSMLKCSEKLRFLYFIE